MTAAMIAIAVVVIVLVISAIAGRRAGYSGLGGDTVVTCSKGHLFTTVWVPGVSLKSIRLGFARFQYCPVGRHWGLVTPVRDCDLTEEDKRIAAEHHDARIP